jgi:hypothetical protein
LPDLRRVSLTRSGLARGGRTMAKRAEKSSPKEVVERGNIYFI